MSQLDMLRSKAKKWGGAVTNIETNYASGTVKITITKGNQNYSFPFSSKTARNSLEILSWSIRTLINCDERGILPFQKTAKEYLQLTGSAEPFVEAEDKYFILLGLTNSASNYEVIKQYKQLSKDLHPDTFAGLNESLKKDAENKFAEITNAYSEIKKARRF